MPGTKYEVFNCETNIIAALFKIQTATKQLTFELQSKSGMPAKAQFKSSHASEKGHTAQLLCCLVLCKNNFNPPIRC